ncbi:MAG: riboflavin biosynthesis protein RibF [Prevotellaceae bacterium]|nr:riboflavin biosynthesis protein RibF [Prevotellaceae bacterium]
MAFLATIGFFDGVHLGHAFLIDQIREQAAMLGLTPTVVTFGNHPKGVIAGKEVKVLTPIDEKTARLTKAGIEHCIVLPFSKELSLMSARDFMMLLHDKYDVKALLMGFDNGFGRDREQNFSRYEALGKEIGIDVMIAKPLLVKGEKIGSSVIRSLIESGDVEHANALLGYHYSITGTVVEGRKIGRSIGFPTANIRPAAADKLIPASGVYAAEVNGRKAMLNIGANPTVTNDGQISIEVHIIGLNEYLYGQTLTVELIKRIREERRFPSIDALKEQIKEDIKVLEDPLPASPL